MPERRFGLIKTKRKPQGHISLSVGAVIGLSIVTVAGIRYATTSPDTSSFASAPPTASASSLGIEESGLSTEQVQTATFANKYEIVWQNQFNLRRKDNTNEWDGGHKWKYLPITVYDNPISHRGKFRYAGKVCIVTFGAKDPSLTNPPTIECQNVG